ncbi:hypothetical protein [Novosphingobium lentum]|uniref:hypothetical protein n=1 Tax=Novosphingobium lentum TaxID=145287 RepID=UPI000836186B|nr:hypothetical protein [Novosphingobium lentum]
MTRTATGVLVGLLALGGCHDSAAAPERIDTTSTAAPSSPLETPTAHAPGATAAWTAGADGRSADFGYGGEAPLLSLACANGAVVVTRHAPADAGAQALFALVGNGRIVRLPVDAVAVPGGKGSDWQGVLPGGDAPTAIFSGGSIDATLPGGGKITFPGGAILQSVIAACRGPAGPAR